MTRAASTDLDDAFQTLLRHYTDCHDPRYPQQAALVRAAAEVVTAAEEYLHGRQTTEDMALACKLTDALATFDKISRGEKP